VVDGTNGHQLTIVVDGHCEGLKIFELDDRVPHDPTQSELREKERYSWTRIPEFDYVPSGRLVFQLDPCWKGRQHTWKDGKRLRIDERISDILDEVETRAVEAEQHRSAEQERKRQRKRDWEQAMAIAGERYVEHALAMELHAQLNSWELANRVRTYGHALDSRKVVASLPPEGSPDWSSWIHAYADSIDPLLRTSGVPEVAAPKPEDLKPFLDGWSPYGPEPRWR